MNNLHRHNLEVLVKLEKNQELKLETVGEVQNKLMPDDSYLRMFGLRSSESIDNILQVYSTSFYHFLNLIQLPDPRLMSSCINLSQLNHTEFQLGVILLLETSLKGLFRYENYYRYYDEKKADAISQVIAKLSNDLIDYKSSVLNLHNSVENEKRLFMQEVSQEDSSQIKETEEVEEIEEIEEVKEDLGLEIITNKDHESKEEIEIKKEEESESIFNKVSKTVSDIVSKGWKTLKRWCRRGWNRLMNLF